MSFREDQLAKKSASKQIPFECLMFNDVNVEHKITVNMGLNDSLPFILRSGFSVAETSHRWTQGLEAVLTVSIDPNKPIQQIIFDTYGLISEKISQKLIIAIQGIEIKTYHYDVLNKHHLVMIDIPIGLSGDVDIHFNIPNACKPYAVDPTNTDQRLLAIAFTSATLIFNDQLKQNNKFRTIHTAAYIQHSIHLYLDNEITINEFIDLLVNSSCPLPPDFNSLNVIKEIAKHPIWQNQGSKALFFSKTPDGISDINLKNPVTLGDCKNIIEDWLKRSSSYYVHGTRSKMTSEFYDLLLKLGKEGMSECICFLASGGFCHKWKLPICSLPQPFVHAHGRTLFNI